MSITIAASCELRAARFHGNRPLDGLATDCPAARRRGELQGDVHAFDLVILRLSLGEDRLEDLLGHATSWAGLDAAEC